MNKNAPQAYFYEITQQMPAYLQKRTITGLETTRQSMRGLSPKTRLEMARIGLRM